MIYIIRKVASGLITMLVIITITFILMHAIPGGPFDSERALPESIINNLNVRYNLDAPLWEQYSNYVQSVLKGDLGPSIKHETKTVNSIIKEGFPVSFLLGSIVLLAALLCGVMFGILSALNKNKWFDYGALMFSTIGISVPSFVLAALLIYYFSLKLGWFPAALWDGWTSMVLPVISLAWLPSAVITRLMRSSMLEIMSKDYIKAARARGIPTKALVLRHALPNAILPVITYLGPTAAWILTGSFVIEKIFAIPGLGQWFVLSISSRDYTVILGLTIFYSFILIGINILIDIVYTLLDPRIKLMGTGKGE